MAMSNAARWRGAAGREGSVERGRAADLVLLRPNPLSEIRHTREVQALVRGGRYHLWDDLDAMLRKVQESADAASNSGCSERSSLMADRAKAEPAQSLRPPLAGAC
ncbi:MAG: hypothetical protein JNK87_10780 [Bryobacterales bacterium]|nr:hypothetical protein [Bryobacterales bacterium]